MADTPPPFATPMAFWGVVSHAAAQGLNAAAAVQAVKAEADRLGVTMGFTGYQAVASLYGQATALRHGSERLAAASPDMAITSEHLAALPYGGAKWAYGGPREFDVRVKYTALEHGQAVTDTLTLRYTGGLPATVGELRDEVGLVTEGLLNGYNRALTGIQDVQIGEL